MEINLYIKCPLCRTYHTVHNTEMIGTDSLDCKRCGENMVYSWSVEDGRVKLRVNTLEQFNV